MKDIVYRPYNGESDLQHIIALVQNELSEPYVIYTYRYFLHQWYVLSQSSLMSLHLISMLQAQALLPRTCDAPELGGGS